MKTIFSAKDVDKCDFVIFFGTQLGNAGAIAESIVETACSEHNLKTLLYSLNQIKDVNELGKVGCPIVIITSTTGDGEPPENADRFWRQLHKKSLDPTTLNSVTYTILGLGDTNFNNFCNCGKQIHKRFQDLRAQLFYPPGWADDAVGNELVIEDWIEGFWLALKQLLANDPSSSFSVEHRNLKEMSDLKPRVEVGGGDTGNVEHSVVLTLPACPAVTLNLEYCPDETKPQEVDLTNPPMPYPLLEGPLVSATISSAKYLTKGNSIKTTLEITFQTEEELDFEPGDAIGIISPNSYEEVENLLVRLNAKEKSDASILMSLKSGVLKGKLPVHLPKTHSTSTLRQLFTYYCDIRAVPKKNFVRLLAENTAEPTEKNTLLHWCSKEGSKTYEESLRSQGLSLLDILLKFPSCHPPLESILENLPRLIPRAYSISSSPLQSNNLFTIAFNVIKIPKENGRQYDRLGVCTGWLYEMASEIMPEGRDDTLTGLKCTGPNDNIGSSYKILFYKRKNHSFRLPTNLKAPVIMVGPGTGVAPFIGFLQHRELQKQKGEEIGELFLYFGCRHKERDFIYRETLEDLQSNGILTQFNVSFSRDEQDNKLKYVQDYMFANKEDIVKTLLENGGYLYVCGDAKNMAKNVHEKLVSCIQTVKDISEKEALEYIADLVLTKRYLKDIWA